MSHTCLWTAGSRTPRELPRTLGGEGPGGVPASPPHAATRAEYKTPVGSATGHSGPHSPVPHTHPAHHEVLRHRRRPGGRRGRPRPPRHERPRVPRQGQRLLEGHPDGRRGVRVAGRLRQRRRRGLRQVPRAQRPGPRAAQGLVPGDGLCFGGEELLRRIGRVDGALRGRRRPGRHCDPLPSAPRRERQASLGRSSVRQPPRPGPGQAGHQPRLRLQRQRRRRAAGRRGEAPQVPQEQGQAPPHGRAPAGVRPAQGHDPHPPGPRRARPQGVERPPARLLLLRHRPVPGRLPALQEDRGRPGSRVAAVRPRRPLGRALRGGPRLRAAPGCRRGHPERPTGRPPRAARVRRRRPEPRLPGAALADYII